MGHRQVESRLREVVRLTGVGWQSRWILIIEFFQLMIKIFISKEQISIINISITFNNYSARHITRKIFIID